MNSPKLADYYRNREQQSLLRAQEASNPVVAEIHTELAQRYRVLASGDEPTLSEDVWQRISF